MPQSNLSFEQRNLHGPVTSTPKNCIHQALITYTGCHHVIIYSTHNSKRQDGLGFIGENGYIFHDSWHCIEVPIDGAYSKIYFMSLQQIHKDKCWTRAPLSAHFFHLHAIFGVCAPLWEIMDPHLKSKPISLFLVILGFPMFIDIIHKNCFECPNDVVQL